MNRKEFGGVRSAALLLLMYSLVGCAHPASSASNAVTPVEGHHAMQATARAIIYFQRPTSDNQKLSAAIAEACHCQPLFFRPYLGDALIYEIALPPGLTFATFAEALMQNAAQLGIRAVEQDSIMQHQ